MYYIIYFTKYIEFFSRRKVAFTREFNKIKNILSRRCYVIYFTKYIEFSSRRKVAFTRELDKI